MLLSVLFKASKPRPRVGIWLRGVTCTANGTLIDQHCWVMASILGFKYDPPSTSCVMVYITLLQIPGEKKTRSASILSQFYLIGYEPHLELRFQRNHIFDVLLKFFRSTSNMH